MADEKPQPQKKKKVRTTRVVKSIERTINTGKYESVRIAVHTEDDIEWSDVSERHLKSQNLVSLLIKDFKETKDRVMEELGLSQRRASMRNAVADAQEDKKPANIGLDDLDEVN